MSNSKKNSKSQLVSEQNGNTSKHSAPNKLRIWFLTLNKPTAEEITQITQLSTKCEEFAWQVEEGDSGTPHIQGVFRWKHQKHFSALKKQFPRAHWEPDRNFEASLIYCNKEKGRILGPFNSIVKPTSDISGRLRLWQCILQKQLTCKPDDRTVTWIYDPVGNTGKTKFCKHLCETRPGTLYLNGGAKYMKYAITQYIDSGGTPEVLLLDLSRSIEGYVSYQGIEEIKNGIFFNTHYEAKMVTYKEPHVVVLANFLPDFEKLSMDRWNIIQNLNPLPLRSVVIAGYRPKGLHNAHSR